MLHLVFVRLHTYNCIRTIPTGTVAMATYFRVMPVDDIPTRVLDVFFTAANKHSDDCCIHMRGSQNLKSGFYVYAPQIGELRSIEPYEVPWDVLKISYQSKLEGRRAVIDYLGPNLSPSTFSALWDL